MRSRKHFPSDPVCGMEVDPAAAAAVRERGGTRYYLCSLGCAGRFDADPVKYSDPAQDGSGTSGRNEG